MAISEIHHVAMAVRDLDRSVNWYLTALGYRATLRMNVGDPTLWRMLGLPEGTTGRSVFVQGPTRLGQIELIQWNGDPLEDRPDGPGALRPGPFLLAVETTKPELDAAFERVVELGEPIMTEPADAELDNYGIIRSFVACDPDGTLVEFVALPSKDEIDAYRAAQEAAAETKGA